MSTMTWISLIGITLAVFALIATLAVREGFRAEFVDAILGSNAHVTVYSAGTVNPQTGRIDRSIAEFTEMAERVRGVEGVTRAAPLVRGRVMANAREANTGLEVFGISPEDLATIPRVADPETALGALADFPRGIAIGSGVARELNVGLGDKVRLILPNGNKTAFGTTPRINAYEVVYIFTTGRFHSDQIRAYLPFEEAQSFFIRDGRADEIEVMVEDPERIEDYSLALLNAAGERSLVWTWQDSQSGFLRTLDVEDNVMFIILSILVLISDINI